MGRIKESWNVLVKSLGFRITLSVGMIVVASYVIVLYFIVEFQESFFTQQMIQEAQTFSTAILNATRHSMLKDDRMATADIVRDLSLSEKFSHIRIYNHDGVVTYADRREEIGTTVNKEAEACFACHAVDKPFSQVSTDKRTRTYRSPENQRVLGMITPIYNSSTCSSATCHVHPASQRVLGIIDVIIPLTNFDAHVRSTISKVIALVALALVVVMATTAAYIWYRVNKPVSGLLKWIASLTQGGSVKESPMHYTGELGLLAKAFKIMSARIARRTKELERSRQQYRTLFEQVPCFISVINRDFRIVRQNSKMREFFRGTVGMHCHEVYKGSPDRCHPCLVEETFRDSKSYRREECGITGTGEEANYLSYTIPIRNDKDEVVYAMAIAIDIGDRIKLEKELQTAYHFQTNLIESSIHGIVATDENGEINIFNRAAENLFGHRAEEVVSDSDLEKYFPKKFVEMIQMAGSGNHLVESSLVAQEETIPSVTNELIPVRFSGVILYDQQNMAGSVGFYQDLRTFKKLEREKADADRLAVVGQTVAGLAHGIKNVLQGLEGGVFVTETALEDDDRELLDRGWEMITRNIGRISALVQDLLSYSKARAPEYQKTDINVLTEEVCALFDARAQDRSIRIERAFSPQLNPICVDQRGIHTVITNLIANAIDACELDKESSSHTITVRTKQQTEGSVEIMVEDDGIGMNEEVQKQLFSVFFTTKGSKGTGLGLLVTSKIVQEHGGEISFESAPGVGTTFTIVLPRGQEFLEDNNETEADLEMEALFT